MPIPPDAAKPTDSFDPTDIVDFQANLTALLEDGEQFQTIGFVVMPESAALGFEIKSAAPHAPVEIDDSNIRFWVGVAAGNQSLGAWNGQGTLCGIEFTAVTNSSPPRTHQRTIAIRGQQK